MGITKRTIVAEQNDASQFPAPRQEIESKPKTVFRRQIRLKLVASFRQMICGSGFPVTGGSQPFRRKRKDGRLKRKKQRD
jgi:hypothetical protein